jgi:large subunit ribosomal protein L15
MELSNLRPAQGSVKTRKRIGRGTGSGRGGTSTRGHKGDKARSGSKEKRHFEGGQTPMQRRLPKRGFQNINRVEYVPLNLGNLEEAGEEVPVTIRWMSKRWLPRVGRQSQRKDQGAGQRQTDFESDIIKVHAISASAKAAIEAAGRKR